MDWKIKNLTKPKLLLTAVAAVGLLGGAALLLPLSWISPSKLWSNVSNSLTPPLAYGDIQIRPGAPDDDSGPGDSFTSGFDDFFNDDFFNMNRDLQRMFHGRLFQNSRMDSDLFSPSHQARIRDDGDSYTVSIDLPGADKKSIDLRVDGDSLRLSSERTEQIEDQSPQSMRQQRFVGRASRSIKLPSPVKKEGATAKYDNGVLTISVQKDRAAENAGDKIEIQ